MTVKRGSASSISCIVLCWSILFLDSPYRDEISKAILKLQESSELQVLKDRWWKEKNAGEKCEASKPQDQASELGLANVGGVFVILLAGLALSFAVAILEFVWKARKSASNFRVSRHEICLSPPPPYFPIIRRSFSSILEFKSIFPTSTAILYHLLQKSDFSNGRFSQQKKRGGGGELSVHCIHIHACFDWLIDGVNINIRSTFNIDIIVRWWRQCFSLMWCVILFLRCRSRCRRKCCEHSALPFVCMDLPKSRCKYLKLKLSSV